MNDIILEVSQLVKHYGDVKAVNEISFSVSKGEIVALLGPNGAGKTTTVSCITSLSEPDSVGSVKIAGMELQKETTAIRRMIGVCPQELNLYKECTVLENLELQGYLTGINPQETKEKADQLLQITGLEDKKDTYAKNLSGGMQRKLQIARSLINSPKILFLDEPTVGLSPEARIEIWDHIRSLKHDGIAIFMTTHYMEEADELADNVLIMDHGDIIASGPPEELKDKYAGETGVLLETSQAVEVSELLTKNNYRYQQLNAEMFSIKELNGRFPELFKLLQGVDIKELTLKKPTLEDVFLHLTGSSLEEAETQEMEVTA